MLQNLPIATAGVWGGASSSSHWASEGAWGNAIHEETTVPTKKQNGPSTTHSGSAGLGFWDDAIISSKQAAPSPVKARFVALFSVVSERNREFLGTN